VLDRHLNGRDRKAAQHWSGTGAALSTTSRLPQVTIGTGFAVDSLTRFHLHTTGTYHSTTLPCGLLP
jgi:hypothetical protein